MMRELNDKNRTKRKIILESIFVLFIAITPFLYKIHTYFPEDPEATVSFLGFTLDDGGFGYVAMYIWFISSKVIPLYLMVIWFMTAKNWWYHIILIPIIMYAFQLFEVLFDSDDYVDTENIWWIIPILMIIIPIVYFIRIRLYDKYVHGIDLEAMEAELKSLKKKQEEKENRKIHKAVDSEKQIEIKTMDTSQI